ncbi:MAG: fibronectin type III domain-containing protein [Actinomycetota bacterium]|nr:fibronectin type III domain-containing protein [Actinomycetota bacterium]
MKRTVGFFATCVAVVALGAGVAVAASSPTVTTGAATSVNSNAETLHATINPNGNQTGYFFQYGLTNAYGLTSTSHSAGGGTKGVKVRSGLGGLTPGTTYHYRVFAENRSGGAYGRDRTFKTAGFPPATVVTGAPSSVRKTIVSLTGSVNPQGTSTKWVVQYGLSTGYGLETFAQTLTPGTTPQPVSATIAGLAPATLFHYRIVAFHPHSTSYGADATFFTEPIHRPKPRLSATTKPSRDRKSPYTFTTTGTVHGARFIPASSRCAGNVALRYYKGRHQVGVVVAPVGSDCRFTAQNSFRPHHIGHGVVGLRIAIHFRGNGYLAPGNRTNHVTAG